MYPERASCSPQVRTGPAAAAKRLDAAYRIATADGTRLGQTEIFIRFPNSGDQALGAQIEIAKAITKLAG
jgi:hypothetical protein